MKLSGWWTHWCAGRVTCPNSVRTGHESSAFRTLSYLPLCISLFGCSGSVSFIINLYNLWVLSWVLQVVNVRIELQDTQLVSEELKQNRRKKQCLWNWGMCACLHAIVIRKKRRDIKKSCCFYPLDCVHNRVYMCGCGGRKKAEAQHTEKNRLVYKWFNCSLKSYFSNNFKFLIQTY